MFSYNPKFRNILALFQENRPNRSGEEICDNWTEGNSSAVYSERILFSRKRTTFYLCKHVTAGLTEMQMQYSHNVVFTHT
jgi:hypothetical protein